MKIAFITYCIVQALFTPAFARRAFGCLSPGQRRCVLALVQLLTCFPLCDSPLTAAVALNDNQYGDSLMCGACVEGINTGGGAGSDPFPSPFKGFIQDK